jgi:hypothetical protein
MNAASKAAAQNFVVLTMALLYPNLIDIRPCARDEFFFTMAQLVKMTLPGRASIP